MGNSTSATIDVVVEPEGNGHGVVTAGNPLKGEVIVKVKKTIEGAPVVLYFSGKEKVAIRTRGAEPATRAERPLIKVDLPLRSFHSNNKIKPGVYSFPFSVPLPESLPSSDKYPLEGNKLGYSVQYRLVASVGRLEKSIPFCVMSAPLPADPVPFMIRPTSYKINSMKVFDAGHLVLGASLTNSNVGRGEEIEMHLACRNDSAVGLRSVEIKLMEYLAWSVVGGRKSDKRESSKALVTVKDVSLPVDHIAKKQRAHIKRRRFDIDLQNTTFVEILAQLQDKQNPVRIKVPEAARDSFEGQLVQIKHRIEINIQTSSLSNNTTTIIPVRIGTPARGANLERPRPTTAVAEVVPPQNPRTLVPAVLYGEDVPHASAVSMEPVRASLVAATADAVVVGGAAVQAQLYESGELSPIAAPPAFSDVEVSVPALLTQMDASVNDYELISHHLMDPRWIRLLGTIEPKQYGAIVCRVKNDGDQPRVAALLAPHVLGGNKFTCAFAAAAVQNTSKWYRSMTAQKLIPLCVDIVERSELIHKELNDWEQTCTAQDFEEAIIMATAA